jgi:hypothetical protein
MSKRKLTWANQVALASYPHAQEAVLDVKERHPFHQTSLKASKAESEDASAHLACLKESISTSFMIRPPLQ